MKPDIQLMRKISDLTLHSLNGTIDEQGMRDLEELLSSNPLAVEYYLEILCTHIGMNTMEGISILQDMEPDKDDINHLFKLLSEEEKAAPAIQLSEAKPQRELIQKVVYPPREKHKISRFDKFMFVVSAAMVLFFVYLSFTPERKVLPIAKVSEGVDTEWLSASGQIAVGSDLYPGPLTLKKGVAQIILTSGACVFLEAPVKVDLETPSRIYLERGRLVTNIERSTEERFVVRTANSTVVDYGTEFGVQVDQAGQLYAHVFKGSVELRQGSDLLKYDDKLRLEAGQSGRAERSGELVRVADKPQPFIRTMPTRYELAVKKTQPLYYWRFDRNPDGLLQNEPYSDLKDVFKLIGSAGYTQGPDLGGSQPNTALHLTGGEDYAVLRQCTAQADNADSFTIAMWVRPETPKAAITNNIIMRVRRGRLGYGHSRTVALDYEKNRICFNTHRTPEDPEKLPANLTVTIGSKPIALDAWYHVVAAYTNSKSVNLYVNGQLEASNKLPNAVESIEISDKIAPCWWIAGFGEKKRPEEIKKGRKEQTGSFTGSVDEISQYNRELSAEEVRMLYEAAR